MINLYALWRKDLVLTFNLQDGIYNNSEDNIQLKASVYNSQKTYTFDILDGKTPDGLPYWTEQEGAIDAYGDFLTDGTNTKYTKIDEDGKTYRFIGWGTNNTSKTPLTNMIVYDRTNHITEYTADHNETFYAMWESALTANVTAKRSLGDLTLPDGTAPKGTANNLTALTPVQTIQAVITSGEQGYYEIIASGSGQYNIKSIFDTAITDIYKDGSTAKWYDKLNPVTSTNKIELLDSSQLHSLNRNINTPEAVITRKFYVPQYLGTDNSYPGNKGVIKYNNEFIISQPSYYWRYVYNKDEIIKVNFELYITPPKSVTETPPVPPTPPIPSTPPGGEDPEDKVTIPSDDNGTTVTEFRTTIIN